MGACNFETFGCGKTVKEAFSKTREDAQYEHGHGGYSGTIAEKHSFTMVGSVKTEEEALELANKLFDAGDSRIQDKWGPAGCIEVKDGKGTFLFFGYASS